MGKPMYELMIESHFSAAHQLRGYKGKCENLHGHNWRVQVLVSSERINEIGLVIDFNDLKMLVTDVLSSVDHTVLNDIFPFTEINPSSENIAKWLHDSIRKKITDQNLQVSSITVWESETASATYYE
jgi:6-pyruvoyltetrahydropterin/6-carboxytetrahydropterin synthase